MVDFTEGDSALLKRYRGYLQQRIYFIERHFSDWYLGKVEQHKDEPVLLPNFIETLLKGYYDDSFVSVLYLQAINWHRSGVDATLSIAASSRLRMLFHNVGNNQSNALAGVMCKLVDLSQAVFAVVYHIADTLDHLRASADSEITRIRALTDSMSSAQPSPLGQAYIDHLSWKLHAYSLALGEREGVDELPLDSSDCHLGQWLAAGGFELIDPELRSGFVAAHDRLHEIAKQLLAFSVQQRPEQMIDHLLNIESASKEVTTVLALHLEREMRDLVTIDNLTRVGNRRGFDQGLSQKMEESARTGVGFGLIFIDIDYFKSINDRYGHTVGDEALQGAVERIKSALRSTDSEYRWGGEEFTVLVGTDSSRGVTQVAERIHAAVGDTPLLTSAGHISITLSLGCTYYAPHTTLSADELVIQADTAMLLAKEQGRNRIICHAEDGAD